MNTNHHQIQQDKILILDFGSQTTQLIARRIRENGVYCEIFSCDVDEKIILDFAPNGIILSGGPQSVNEDQSLRAPEIIFTMQCPILGICYGMQTMAKQLQGSVESSGHREFGQASLEIIAKNSLFSDSQILSVWMSHGDKVINLPLGFETIASSQYAPVAAMADEKRKYYGVQFHPEVTHTEDGNLLLQTFVQKICKCQSLWTVDNIIENDIEAIRKQIGTDKVILGLSGGVDSSVLAMLLHKAIGSQLICVFIDNGLLRANEAEQVLSTFRVQFKMNLFMIDAKDKFLQALKGISEPEQKRKVIGHVFIDVFVEYSKQHPGVKWLAQGTIYPDVIESASSKTGKATVIKSHHNVGGLPDKLPLKLLEPFRELFKDEIRKIGHYLGLPNNILYRHPFPGPGLGVRVLGEIKEEYLELLRACDKIFIETLHEFDWYNKTSQAFVVFMPVKSVAVLGDARSYDYVVALRCVNTQDFMTADWTHLPYELLAKTSKRIINEVRGISRVTYDISSKPPATIEWE